MSVQYIINNEDILMNFLIVRSVFVANVRILKCKEVVEVPNSFIQIPLKYVLHSCERN